MNVQLSDSFFPGFDYSVKQLSKYIRAGDIFTIMLNNGDIIHYITRPDFFERWLEQNEITNIRDRK